MSIIKIGGRMNFGSLVMLDETMKTVGSEGHFNYSRWGTDKGKIEENMIVSIIEDDMKRLGLKVERQAVNKANRKSRSEQSTLTPCSVTKVYIDNDYILIYQK